MNEALLIKEGRNALGHAVAEARDLYRAGQAKTVAATARVGQGWTVLVSIIPPDGEARPPSPSDVSDLPAVTEAEGEPAKEPPTSGLLGLAEASRLIRGEGGAHACVASLRRWSSNGYRPRCGRGDAILLRVVRIGNDLLTRREWIEEFEAARLRVGEIEPPPPAILERPERSRAAAQRRAEAYLDKHGVR